MPCPLRALIGIPCPTCFLTRSTSLALQGDFTSSLQLHSFGPLTAGALVAWSVWSFQQQRLLPQQLPAWPLAAMGSGLVTYWAVRLGLYLGLGWQTFPDLPVHG